MLDFIYPDWPAPRRILAASTTRTGGVSQPPFDSFNLAGHVQDDANLVAQNRALLREVLQLPQEPGWLQQVHGTEIVQGSTALNCEADGAYSNTPGQVCVVMTADCLPVLLCDRGGSEVGALHAGWRGLVNGVIEQGLNKFSGSRKNIMAWLGPAIGPAAFEVGDEVRQQFIDSDTIHASAFSSNRPGHWLADLYQLARQRLESAGVAQIYGGNYCTFSEPERFFSYRRDGVTGRMASLIWIDK